jgi:threonine/homoserine/homoserine lactone efflux protein
MSVIFAMASFALSMSISPGPVNLITLASGINHGFVRTLPFVAGASIGFSLLLFMLGLGLTLGFDYLPSYLMTALQILGALFIAYLGIQTIRSAQQSAEAIDVKNDNLPGFLKGALLQWLNPKAWIACLSGITAFQVAHSVSLLMTFTTLYLIICFISISCWAALGNKLQNLLQHPQHLMRFNQLMGAGLILIAGHLLII